MAGLREINAGLGALPHCQHGCVQVWEAVMPNYDYFADAVAPIEASVESVFEFLDDQSNLSSHMNERSWMMLGSTMDIFMDEHRTRLVGSRFGFTGRVLGIPLRVDEIVTSREPPVQKTWETTAEPTLWVIGRYEMGLELSPRDGLSELRVYIRYNLPATWFPRLLGMAFGRAYGRWCASKMVSDARKHFAARRGNEGLEHAR
jgi:hypothetical protein